MRLRAAQHPFLKSPLRLAGILLLLFSLGNTFEHVAGADHGFGERCDLCLLFAAKEVPAAAAFAAISFFWLFLFRPLYLAPVSRRYRFSLGRSPPRSTLR